MGQIGDALPVHQAVASGALGAALDRVPRHGPRREQVPGVGLPVEGVNQRRERESRVGDAAGDHDIRAASQRLRSEEHTSELQSQSNLVCRLLLEKKKKKTLISKDTLLT